MAKRIETSASTKGEPILVMNSITEVRAGVRIRDIALSIPVSKGVSSPAPLVTPAVMTTKVSPEKTARSKKKMFLMTRVGFIQHNFIMKNSSPDECRGCTKVLGAVRLLDGNRLRVSCVLSLAPDSAELGRTVHRRVDRQVAGELRLVAAAACEEDVSPQTAKMASSLPGRHGRLRVAAAADELMHVEQVAVGVRLRSRLD